MKNISLKGQLAFFLFIFLCFVSFQERHAVILLNGVFAAGVSVLADAVCGFWRQRKWRFSESALVTGLLIGFILSAQEAWWFAPAAAMIAIFSKQFLRIKGRHIFNPAAFGAMAAVLFLNGNTFWYGAYEWFLVIPAGLYFVSRLKRLPTVAAFYLAAAALYGGQALLHKTSFPDSMIYLNHFFIFVMLIEPKTSPFDKAGMMMFGGFAGVLSFLGGVLNLPYSPELPVLLTMNLFYAGYQKIKGGKHA